MQRDSIVFYRIFFEAINSLPQHEQPTAYKAVMDYAFNGNIDNTGGLTAVIFNLIKPQLDANNRRYENGLKGGRKPKPNQTETKPKPKDNQSITKTEPNVNVNVNDNDNDNVNGNNGISSEPHASDKPKFTPEHKAYQCAVFLDKEICERLPKKKHVTEAQLQKWADEFDKVRRIDGYDDDMIAEVLEFSQSDEFWQRNILSGEKFRKQFVKLYAQMGGKRH